MKNYIYVPIPILKLICLIILPALFISCGGYTDASYNDGIYENDTRVINSDREVRPQSYQDNKPTYYEQLFAQELDRTGVQQEEDNAIFTDVDQYSSGYYNENTNDYATNYNGAPAWGSNPSDVQVNYYGGFNNGFGFNPYFGYGGWGIYNGFGFGYDPFFGFNRFNRFGLGFGFYDPFFPGYGFNPYFNNFYGGYGYGGFGYGGFNNFGNRFYNNRVAYTNGYRTSARNNMTGVNSRLSSSRSTDVNTRGRATTTATDRRTSSYPTYRTNPRSSQTRSATSPRSTMPNARSTTPTRNPNVRSSNSGSRRSSGTVRPSTGGSRSTGGGRSSGGGRSGGGRSGGRG